MNILPIVSAVALLVTLLAACFADRLGSLPYTEVPRRSSSKLWSALANFYTYDRRMASQNFGFAVSLCSLLAIAIHGGAMFPLCLCIGIIAAMPVTGLLDQLINAYGWEPEFESGNVALCRVLA